MRLPFTIVHLTAFITFDRSAPFRQKAIAAVASSTGGGPHPKDTSRSSNSNMTPPRPRRDLERVVLVGKTPSEESDPSEEKLLDPPVAVPDPYGWLRDETRKNPEVLEHLKAENAYTESSLAHLEPLRTTLYEEMVNSMRETDYTTPRPFKDFYYYSRTFKGKAYSQYCRAPRQHGQKIHPIQWDGSPDTPILPDEDILLDVNELAKDKEYCDVASTEDSPSQNLLAYTVDYAGDEIYKLYVKNITTGDIVDHDEELEVDGSIVWGKDDDTLFYLKMDDAMRPFQVYRRKLGSGEPDELLYQEDDEMFWVGIGKSDDHRYIFIATESIETSEVYYLDLEDPTSEMKCVAKRRPKVLYNVEHQKGNWWIQSNVGGLPNLALWKCPATPNCEDSWELVRNADGMPLFDGGHEPSLDEVSMFANHVVISGRTGGLPRIWFASLDSTGKEVTSFSMLEFPEKAFDVDQGSNYEYETDRVAIAYDSLVTPTQILEVNLSDPSDRVVLKQKEVPGYEPSLYECERVHVTARDGKTAIPVSLVFRKDTIDNHRSSGKPVPLLLYGTLKSRVFQIDCVVLTLGVGGCFRLRGIWILRGSDV